MLKFKLSKKTISLVVAIICGIVTIAVFTFLNVGANPDSVSFNFASEDHSHFGKGTSRLNVSGDQATVAPCYVPSPSWNKEYINTLIVRDISILHDVTATTAADLYCDTSNCVFVTAGYAPPSPLCIATNPNVHANVLWRKTDTNVGTGYLWSITRNWIQGDDVGGTHPSNLYYSNSRFAGAASFLERYYGANLGQYPAMDACKSVGSGWRLPTIIEIESIRANGVNGNPRYWLNGLNSAVLYWTSTENSETSALHWRNGQNSMPSVKNTASGRIRCVREW